MNSEQFIKKIESFKKELPYTRGEYVKKTWGHDLHSLCSYQGKLKPAVAHWLVKMFSEEGDVVLDPLGGVGTIALEASLPDLSRHPNLQRVFLIDTGINVKELPNYLQEKVSNWDDR